MDQGQALLDALGEWDGFDVTGVERREGDPDGIHVSLKPIEDVPLYCNCCGRACERVHEHVQRTARNLPLITAITYLDITIYRVWCDHCGQLSIQHVAKFYRLHWHTVKRIDKRTLNARLDPVEFSNMRIIGMDESPLHTSLIEGINKKIKIIK